LLSIRVSQDQRSTTIRLLQINRHRKKLGRPHYSSKLSEVAGCSVDRSAASTYINAHQGETQAISSPLQNSNSAAVGIVGRSLLDESLALSANRVLDASGSSIPVTPRSRRTLDPGEPSIPAKTCSTSRRIRPSTDCERIDSVDPGGKMPGRWPSPARLGVLGWVAQQQEASHYGFHVGGLTRKWKPQGAVSGA